MKPACLFTTILRGRLELLDWGVKTYREPDPFYKSHLIQKRVEPLLTLYHPTLIVTNSMPTLKRSKEFGQDEIIQVIRDQARKHSAQLTNIARAETTRTFLDVAATTKTEIAAYITVLFPELAWKLPPPRKVWESEHYNMAIFDAIALGLTSVVS